MARDWASELLGGGGDGEVIQAQAAAPKARDWAEEMLNGTATPAQPKPQAQPEKGNFISRTVDAIKGKQDPRYTDVPAFNIDAAGFPVVASTAIASMGGADDKAYADVIEKSLGDKFRKRYTDANGYEIIEHVDDKGNLKRGYVNTPGLDMGDVQRGAMGMLKYIGAGRLMGGMMKGAPLGFRVPAQIGAQSSASVLGDVASMAVGSKQGVNKTNALIAGATGGMFEALPSRAIMPVIGAMTGFGATMHDNEPTVGELSAGTAAGAATGYAVSLLARRFLGMAPGLYVNNGQLTQKGAEAARAAGRDPAEIQGEIADIFAKEYAKTRNAAQAAMAADQGASGIPTTVGQRTRDITKLLEEDQMRWGIKGEQPKEIITAFDKRQQDALRQQVFGGMKMQSLYGPGGVPYAPGVAPPPPLQVPTGIAPQISPSGWQVRDPASLGGTVRSGAITAKRGADAVEDAAWKQVGTMRATPEALDALPTIISKEIADGGIPISADLTPNAAKMVEVLRNYKAGKSPGSTDEFVPSFEGQSVDQIRRLLGKQVRDAQSGTDREASGTIYRAYNNWIKEASDTALMAGDPGAAVALRNAIEISKEVKGIWEPLMRGQKTPAANKLAKVLQNDGTPENVVKTLIGDITTKATVQNGTVPALQSLKTGLYKFAPKEVADETWQSLGLAYWHRMTIGKDGQLLTPGAMLKNIRSAQSEQSSVYQILIPAEAQRSITRLMRDLETISYTPPRSKVNPSGSGLAVGVMAKQLLEKIWEAFGLNSKLAQTALQATPFVGKLPESWATQSAKQAIDQTSKEIVPSLGGYGAAASSVYERQR
ncbi:hypothetical protein [Caudoviricetes sp.]|nr:hypothetical protein [Caudoviricetes sp.]